jgi:hypothetical protein
VITWDVGVTDKLNSELPELPEPEPVTRRRGDIVQPVDAMIIEVMKVMIMADSTYRKRIGNGVSSLSSSRRLAQPVRNQQRILCLIAFPRRVFARRNGKMLTRETLLLANRKRG